MTQKTFDPSIRSRGKQTVHFETKSDQIHHDVLTLENHIDPQFLCEGFKYLGRFEFIYLLQQINLSFKVC